MDFLSALGRRLQPATASDGGRSAQAALAEIWRIAPLPNERRGPAGTNRGYTEEIGKRLLSVMNVVVHVTNQVYDHAAMQALFASHAHLCERSRWNLRAIVHPQNPLRPFDPLLTIGRGFQPAMILTAFFRNPQVSTLPQLGLSLSECLRAGTCRNGDPEIQGSWQCAWFIGLLVSLYLSWRWHDEISLSQGYEGWFAAKPLASLIPAAPIDIRFPGSMYDLVSQDAGLLRFSELNPGWTYWPRDRRKTIIWNRGPLPQPVGAVDLPCFGGWLLTNLGIYRGAHDCSLHGEGTLDALLVRNRLPLQSHLHELKTLVHDRLPGLEYLFDRVPPDPELNALPEEFSPAVRQLLTDHRRGLNRDGEETEHGIVLPKYPIDTLSAGLGAQYFNAIVDRLRMGMPRFRELTSAFWMLIMEDRDRLRCPHAGAQRA